MTEGLETKCLPVISYKRQGEGSDVSLLVVPLNKEQKKSLTSQHLNKEGIRQYLAEKGLVLGINKDGSLSLFDMIIPARGLHQAIRDQDKDPNQIARWLAGQGYNPLSEAVNRSGEFYASLETDRFEVGFVTFPQGGEKDPLITQGKVHCHPECAEIYIITMGKITIMVDVEKIARSSGTVNVKGEKIVLDINEIKEKKNNNLPAGIRVCRDRDGKVIALAYTITHGSYHLLTEVSPGTELILIKRRLGIPATSTEDWRRSELHSDEK
jgi:hypothetical protein